MKQQPLTVDQQRALMSSLGEGRVKKRKQGGRELSYLASQA